jgi:hypothetical protein
MNRKPLPLELIKPLIEREALEDLADKIGQFEDAKAFQRLRSERAKQVPDGTSGGDRTDR